MSLFLMFFLHHQQCLTKFPLFSISLCFFHFLNPFETRAENGPIVTDPIKNEKMISSVFCPLFVVFLQLFFVPFNGLDIKRGRPCLPFKGFLIFLDPFEMRR